MKIFIPGGAGFIGSNLAEYHLKLGDTVTVMDNFSGGSRDNIATFKSLPNFKLIEADLLRTNQLDELCNWADIIYHVAALVGLFKVLQDPLDVLRVNVLACERVLAAAKNNKNARIIVCSSSSVYGSRVDEFMNEQTQLHINVSMQGYAGYAVSKIMDEFFALAYAQSHNMAITVVRLFNTIGPKQTGRYGMVVPRFIKQATHNEPITVFGDGQQIRSFCDVRDVVAMLNLLCQSSKAVGKIINVGNLQEITINELAEKIKSLSGSQSPIIHIPLKEAYGQEYAEVRSRKPDLTLLHGIINYKPQWTLDQTLSNLINFS
jgi:UDP-glucose 4-epimerase